MKENLKKVSFNIDLAKKVVFNNSGNDYIALGDLKVDIIKFDNKNKANYSIVALVPDSEDLNSFHPELFLEDGTRLGSDEKLTIFISNGTILSDYKNKLLKIKIKNSINNEIKTILALVKDIDPKGKIYTDFEIWLKSYTTTDGTINYYISEAKQIRIKEDLPLCEKTSILDVEFCNKEDIEFLKNNLTKFNYSFDEESLTISKLYSFNAGDKILGKDGSGVWRFDFFSHMLGDKFCCTGRTYSRIIPFEGNEDLAGKL